MRKSLQALDFSEQTPVRSGLPGSRAELERQWKTPLGLAVAVHVAVLLLGLLSPLLFNRRPVLPEIYQVSLFNASEVAGPAPSRPETPAPAPAPKKQPAQPEPAPQPVKTMEPVQLKKEAPTASPRKPAAPAQRPALSEKPLKTRAKSPEDLAALRALRRNLAAQKAREAEQLADQKVQEALSSIKRIYKQDEVPAPAAPVSRPAAAAALAEGRGTEAGSPAASGSGRDSAVLDEVRNRYLAAVHSRIQEHWALPDIQGWDENLEAIMVIQVRRDGIVADSFFEKKADNLYFDQFVEKTIKEAAPLPPFPPELKESRLEIGLIFRPGELL